ncbi:hypothetical protein HYPSUDRAFT_208676 [Hypholoma sublateritium FD-334 SS-4]|uniref:Uncharacterized protein n=1 Tax=Hypholoma sublateritium (strain FD-334 SS-4) TaxID=945553 RepID=A0A0D2KIG9_HYPSF|nr:hypothetical protein HYPSUDRAFT_208676 [Hypholoma sublateritium FD-334 SS-4]
MPIGPILQALWRDPESARRFNYRRSKTQEIIETLHSNSGKLPAYDDFFHGSDYLEHVRNGSITDNDIILMFSIDGAQLYAHKASDCWIYIWVILDLNPEERYKKDFVIPGGFIPGPKKPKNLDSFLFPGLYHLSALQKERLSIWDAANNRLFKSLLFLGLNTADGPAMAYLTGLVGHHGNNYTSSATNSQDCEVPNTPFELDDDKPPPAANLAFLSNPSLLSKLGGSAIYSFDWSDTYSDSPINSQSSEAAAIVHYPFIMVQPEERDYRWAVPHLPPPVFWSAITHANKFDKYIQAAGLNTAVYPTAFPSTELHVAASEPINLKPPKGDAAAKTNKRAMAIANAHSKKVLHGRSLSWVTSELFADNKLPAPFNRDAVAMCKRIWTGPPGMSTFSSIPDLAKDEDTERWFNFLSQFLGVVHGYAKMVPDPRASGRSVIMVQPPVGAGDRAYSRGGSKKAPAGGLLLRKPDIVVVDRAFKRQPPSKATLGWSMLQALIEVTSDESRSYNEMLTNMLEKAANFLLIALARLSHSQPSSVTITLSILRGL